MQEHVEANWKMELEFWKMPSKTLYVTANRRADQIRTIALKIKELESISIIRVFGRIWVKRFCNPKPSVFDFVSLGMKFKSGSIN